MRYELQQRLYPSLRIGLTATAIGRRGQEIRLHCRQGAWDGACGLYCAAMALALLGRLSSTARLPERRNSLAGRFWRLGCDKYFEGLSSYELVDLIRALDDGLLVKRAQGAHSSLLRLTRAQLEAGQLVIVAWSSRNRQLTHWVLAVGLEGRVLQERFRPTAILCLDPSGTEPVLCGYNGRLELTGNPASYDGTFIRYLSNQGDVIPVKLTEVVVVGDSYSERLGRGEANA